MFESSSVQILNQFLCSSVSGGSRSPQQYPGEVGLRSSLHQLLSSDLVSPHAGDHRVQTGEEEEESSG